MLNTKRIALALALAGLAMAPSVYAQAFFGTEEGAKQASFRTEENEKVYPGRGKANVVKPATRAAFDGFTYVGGDTGWEPTSHKLVWVGGKFAHSNECDHEIRMAKAPTPQELDAARRAYSGG